MTIPRIVLATRNAHKVEEFARILAAAGLVVELVAVSQFPDIPDVEETGATFAENALLKATTIANATGLPAVADDSGLSVDALNGMPGVLSARWSGRHGDDAANLQLVLGQLRDVPADRRGARFVCAAAFALPADAAGEQTSRVVEGEVLGSLTFEPRGSNGFGYDPIFVPTGATQTTAELSPAQKDAISHRGQALRALVPIIRELALP
ncbi:MAG: RdgB/HAM1 family non-canonical purine NTP pyrophosphatase [Actinomycetes bacterium]